MDTKPLNKGMTSVLIICNEASTAPVWGYMIREKKLRAVIETNPHYAPERCKGEEPALTILDLQLSPAKILDICHQLRTICDNPILLFLPTYDENLILGYYDVGIDDCVVKPISPAVFYAKVKAWLRHTKRPPVDAMREVQVGNICLDPNQNLLKIDGGTDIKLTDLEVHLLTRHPSTCMTWSRVPTPARSLSIRNWDIVTEKESSFPTLLSFLYSLTTV